MRPDFVSSSHQPVAPPHFLLACKKSKKVPHFLFLETHNDVISVGTRRFETRT